MGCCDGEVRQVLLPGADVQKIMGNLPVVVLGVNPSKCSPFHQLGFSLPPDDGKVRQHGRPVFHCDGRIEYPLPPPTEEMVTAPPDIQGYRRDETNPFLFHPEWLECTTRMQGLKFDPKSGAVGIKMVCSHPTCEQRMKFVTPDICAACPLRQQKNPAQAGA